jgi:CheY-like chemotaxis protein
MPEMTGIELIEYLHSQGANLPVIVLSSVIDQQAHASALSLGVRIWITKPASDEQLLGAIAAAIEDGPATGGG